MDIREKLVELLTEFYGCDPMYYDVDALAIAQHLFSRGVTVQEVNGCKYCKEYEDLPEHFIDSKPVGRVFDTCIQPNKNGLWHLEVPCGADIDIRFCPMCGREFPKPPKGE